MREYYISPPVALKKVFGGDLLVSFGVKITPGSTGGERSNNRKGELDASRSHLHQSTADKQYTKT